MSGGCAVVEDVTIPQMGCLGAYCNMISEMTRQDSGGGVMQLFMDGNRGIADILEACHGQTT